MNQKITFGVLIVLNLLTATICVKAQTTKKISSSKSVSINSSKPVNNDNNVYNTGTIEEQPIYQGGEKALLKYLHDNIKYPAIARESCIEGTVYVEFVIGKDGAITGANIKRGIGGGCNEEALKLVKAMPKWKPGRYEGKAVKVKYTLPIKFKL